MEISENVKIEFEEFMKKELPLYNELLEEVEISDLLNKYNQWKKACDAAEYCLKQQLSLDRGIDYTNDFEKNMERASLLKNSIISYIEKIKQNEKTL